MFLIKGTACIAEFSRMWGWGEFYITEFDITESATAEFGKTEFDIA